jgi:hypothetical protein
MPSRQQPSSARSLGWAASLTISGLRTLVMGRITVCTNREGATSADALPALWLAGDSAVTFSLLPSQARACVLGAAGLWRHR